MRGDHGEVLYDAVGKVNEAYAPKIEPPRTDKYTSVTISPTGQPYLIITLQQAAHKKDVAATTKLLSAIWSASALAAFLSTGGTLYWRQYPTVIKVPLPGVRKDMTMVEITGRLLVSDSRRLSQDEMRDVLAMRV